MSLLGCIHVSLFNRSERIEADLSCILASFGYSCVETGGGGMYWFDMNFEGPTHQLDCIQHIVKTHLSSYMGVDKYQVTTEERALMIRSS